MKKFLLFLFGLQFFCACADYAKDGVSFICKDEYAHLTINKKSVIFQIPESHTNYDFKRAVCSFEGDKKINFDEPFVSANSSRFTDKTYEVPYWQLKMKFNPLKYKNLHRKRWFEIELFEGNGKSKKIKFDLTNGLWLYLSTLRDEIRDVKRKRIAEKWKNSDKMSLEEQRKLLDEQRKLLAESIADDPTTMEKIKEKLRKKYPQKDISDEVVDNPGLLLDVMESDSKR